MSVVKVSFDQLFFDDYYPLDQLREMQRDREDEIYSLDHNQTKKAFSLFFGVEFGQDDEDKDYDAFFKWFNTFFEEVDLDDADFLEYEEPSGWDADD
jgi:hypothetical protein